MGAEAEAGKSSGSKTTVAAKTAVPSAKAEEGASSSAQRARKAPKLVDASAPPPEVEAQPVKVKAERKPGDRKGERKRNRKRMAVKDPQEALAYLQKWECRGAPGQASSDAPWKFNKATQAWLIRHAYEPERVAKDAFRLLLRYLAGLQGAARERVSGDAGAIIALKGAALNAIAEDEEEEAEEGDEQDVAAGDTKGRLDGKKRKKGDEVTGDGGEDDATSRKLRLSRAKQILAILGEEREDSDGPDT